MNRAQLWGGGVCRAWPGHDARDASLAWKAWMGRNIGRAATPPGPCLLLPTCLGREGGSDGATCPSGCQDRERQGRTEQGKARQDRARPGKARQGAHGEWQGRGCLSAERPRRGPLGFPAKAGRSSPAARAWLLLAWQLRGRAKRRERRGACACTGGCKHPPLLHSLSLGGKKKGNKELVIRR